MQVLLDADMPAHELGHLKRDTGEVDDNGDAVLELFDFDEVAPICRGRVMSIILGSGAGSWTSYLTGGRHYRHRNATILPYKGHREDQPRNNVDKLKTMLHTHLDAIWCKDREADDALATDQWSDIIDVGSQFGWDDTTLRKYTNTVIASRDKDLDNVPCWHYKWFIKGHKDPDTGEVITSESLKKKKGRVYWVTLKEAIRNFYVQLLVGDSADNIHGLYNVGPKSAWVKQLVKIEADSDELVTGIETSEMEEEMYDHVLVKYEKYYGNYGEKFLFENANLLHMQRRRDDVWYPPDDCERDEEYFIL